MAQEQRIEHVMVVPSNYAFGLGVKHGLTTTDYHGIIYKLMFDRRATFMTRERAEIDPSFLQIIPYVVFTHQDRVFTYVRGKGGSEKRLHGHRAIGIGGHINHQDAVGYPFYDAYFYTAYIRGMEREVAEEVLVVGDCKDHVLGLIYTDVTPVGRVHLGILHHIRLQDETDIAARSYGEITDPGFISIDQLSKGSKELPVDDWAGICLPGLRDVL